MRVWTWILMAAAALAVFSPRAAWADSAMTYDGANRLAKTVKDGQVTTYGYDGEGNLVRECTGPNEASLVCTDLFQDASALPRVVGKVSGGNETLHAYGPAGFAAQRAVVSGTGQDVEYALTDHQGTVRGTVTSSGAVSARTSYDAYGAVRAQAGAPSSLGYTGEHTGPEGVVNLRARSYLPEIGRFPQRDTFTLGGDTTQGLNRYAYVSNNPVGFVDPSGHRGRPNVREMEKARQRAAQIEGIINSNRNLTAEDVQRAIVRAANGHRGSQNWLFEPPRNAPGANFKAQSDKCNQFIFELINEVNDNLGLPGAISNPTRQNIFGQNAGPPSVDNWPMKGPFQGWSPVDSPQPGDIALDGKHIGIVTAVGGEYIEENGDGNHGMWGWGLTTSATQLVRSMNGRSYPLGVAQNTWGFRPGQTGVRFYRSDLVIELLKRRGASRYTGEVLPGECEKCKY